MEASLRRAILSIAAMLAAILVYAMPAGAFGGGCYTCLASCPTSSGSGAEYCDFYCNGEPNWSCDEDEVCPSGWIQLNCYDGGPT